MAGYLSNSQVRRDMKYIKDINKIGYQNANDVQKKQMYNLRKKYGDSIYKNGSFNPDSLSSKNKTLYTKYNPNSTYTRQRQEGFFNTVDERLKNNQSVSDDQMKSYKDYMNKWNLTPHDKRVLTYEDATKQASQQVDPLYQQALKGLQQEKYQNELNAGEVAQNRGLGRSGLAADQLNKIAIATQNQSAQLGAERATQIAELSTALRDKDQSRVERAEAIDYQKYRDKIADQRYNKEFTYSRSRDQIEDEWREHVYNTMSASERAQLDADTKRYGQEDAWRRFQFNNLSATDKQTADLNDGYNQAMLDALQNGNFLP